jgi:hypothetical protein
MRYFILAVLSCGMMACGGGSKQVAVTDSVAIPVTKVSCTEDQAIAAISKLPDVVKQQHYLDSLTGHKRGVNYLTDSKVIDGKDYWEISAGYISDIRRENYWIFYVDKQNCGNISVMDPVEGNIVPVGTAEAFKAVATKPVQLPFKFTEFLDNYYNEATKAKYSESYPSYPMENDPRLKALVDKEADLYFVLPEMGGVAAYVVETVKKDVSRYLLVTVVNDKLVGKVKIGQTDDTDTHTHFVVEKGNVVSVYEHIDEEEESTLKRVYHIGEDGSIK